MTPTPEQIALAKRVPYSWAAIAEAIAAAEVRGHTRAVESTAIASIHKAVAAERAAVVRRLREWASVGRVATADDYADEIEAGDHHEVKP